MHYCSFWLSPLVDTRYVSVSECNWTEPMTSSSQATRRTTELHEQPSSPEGFKMCPIFELEWFGLTCQTRFHTWDLSHPKPIVDLRSLSHTHIPQLNLSLTHARSLTLSLSLSHTHTPHNLSLTHKRSLPLYLSFSLPCTHTHKHSHTPHLNILLSLSPSQSHSLKHTLRLSSSLFLSLNLAFPLVVSVPLFKNKFKVD